jgi:hypothetical protein
MLAEALYRSKEFAEERDVLEAIIGSFEDTEPSSNHPYADSLGEAHYLLAQSYFVTEGFRDAEVHYEIAGIYRPHDSKIDGALGRLYWVWFEASGKKPIYLTYAIAAMQNAKRKTHNDEAKDAFSASIKIADETFKEVSHSSAKIITADNPSRSLRVQESTDRERLFRQVEIILWNFLETEKLETLKEALFVISNPKIPKNRISEKLRQSIQDLHRSLQEEELAGEVSETRRQELNAEFITPILAKQWNEPMAEFVRVLRTNEIEEQLKARLLTLLIDQLLETAGSVAEGLGPENRYASPRQAVVLYSELSRHIGSWQTNSLWEAHLQTQFLEKIHREADKLLQFK